MPYAFVAKLFVSRRVLKTRAYLFTIQSVKQECSKKCSFPSPCSHRVGINFKLLFYNPTLCCSLYFSALDCDFSTGNGRTEGQKEIWR